MKQLNSAASNEKEPIERFYVSDETKRLSADEKVEKIKSFFQQTFQRNTVRFDMDGTSILVITNQDTRKNFFWKKNDIRKAEHIAKRNIAAEGQYWSLIANAKYLFSSEEEKRHHSNLHKNTVMWHYFMKPIVYEGAKYHVVIDVREDKQQRFLIHNISLRYKG